MPPILISVQSILGFENQQKIIKRFGDLKTTVVDGFFPAEKRRNNPSPLIKLNELYAPVKAVALSRRGDEPQRIDKETMSGEAIEPFPINVYRSMTGADLNNWRIWDGKGREGFIARQLDLNRHTIRLTTEAMSAQAITTGALDYPVVVDGALTGSYQFTFGSITAVSVTTLWSAAGAKLADALKPLVDIRKQIQLSGYGSSVKFMAGEKAFYALVNLVTSLSNDNRIPAKVEENTVNIAGNVVRLVSETYTNPVSGAVVKKVPDTAVYGYAEDAPHELIYSSLDNIDSNFIAAPFWSKAVKTESGNAIKIISESKPLPVPYTHAIAKATVAS